MNNNLIAQLVGIGATILLFCTYQFNDRKKIMILQFFNVVCWAIHYALLGAVPAILINIVCILRSGVYAWCDRNKKWPWVVPAAICALEVGLTILAWQDAVDILAMAGASLQSTALWIKEPKKMRRCMITASPLWMVYDAFRGSYAGILTETLVIISLLTAMIRFDFRKKGEKA